MLVFGSDPLLGIGMVLLASSPGGTTANLFSHSSVATWPSTSPLTAINSVISMVTLPLITGLAIACYDRGDEVALRFVEIVKVFALILVPVGLGGLLRRRNPAFPARMDRPVRIGSALILAVLIVGIMLDQRADIEDHLADVSLVVGYVVPRALGVI